MGGFSGSTLPPRFEKALRAGERGGAILFKRNVTPDLWDLAELTRAIREASPEPPLVAVDQEGGRVARLGPPALRVPPMRRLADTNDEALLARVAGAQARQLAALGFSTGFAPVLDVNTRPENPVIGDRAFGDDPARVAHLGVLYARALEAEGVFACGKHYPGHGDTTVDSHLGLPRVDRPKDELARIELAPFRAAAEAGIGALMTAHVVYPAWDASAPATLSHAICTDLLRGELGYRGVLFSDDLEMKALSPEIESTAVLAVRAGCDVLLVCASEDLADRAHAALVREAEASASFRARCEEAHARARALRLRATGRAAATREELEKRLAAEARVQSELDARFFAGRA